jgi:2-polyprenyl-3-methyl-5-hydroxy-6-metoxy-1,4-benzoquinol methylase
MIAADNGHLRSQAVRLPVHRCLDCDVFFLNPPPPPEIGRQYFAEAYAGQGTGSNVYYDDAFKERTALARLDLLNRSGAPGRSRLDVGCGKGQFVRAAVRNGWDAWGVELDEGACRYARTVLGLSSVLHGSLDHPELPEAFDVVTLWDVIEHVPDPLGLLRQVERRLSHGGLVAIRTANIRSWAFDRNPRGWWAFGSDHRFYFSPGSLTVALARADLSVARVIDHEAVERPDKRPSRDISETPIRAGLLSLLRQPGKVLKLNRFVHNLYKRRTGLRRFGEHYHTSIMTALARKRESASSVFTSERIS